MCRFGGAISAQLEGVRFMCVCEREYHKSDCRFFFKATKSALVFYLFLYCLSFTLVTYD